MRNTVHFAAKPQSHSLAPWRLGGSGFTAKTPRRQDVLLRLRRRFFFSLPHRLCGEIPSFLCVFRAASASSALKRSFLLGRG